MCNSFVISELYNDPRTIEELIQVSKSLYTSLLYAPPKCVRIIVEAEL